MNQNFDEWIEKAIIGFGILMFVAFMLLEVFCG